MQQKAEVFAQKTRHAFLWTRVLDAPFWAIYIMLPFILYKDLHATPFQIAVVFAIQPVGSLLSMYWSMLISNRPDRLRSNIVWGGILRHLPFFFFPFFHSPWFFIAAYGFQMMLYRGTQPAWMEILKQNVPHVKREKLFAYGSSLSYIGDALLPFVLGPMMDHYFEAWRWIFPLAAGFSLISTLIQSRIPVTNGERSSQEKPERRNISKHLLAPWISAWKLIKSRPDFARFQVGFMLGGGGLMIIKPMLPVFFVDTLHVTYSELSVALILCKAIGFVSTSSFWAKWLHRMNIFRFSSLVTLMAALFPICIFLSSYQFAFLYVAYIGYGIMQAGSTLSWNLSGPIFSKEGDSSVFTGVNVVSVGIRGLVAPTLGSLLLGFGGTTFVLVVGMILFFAATVKMLDYSRLEQKARFAS